MRQRIRCECGCRNLIDRIDQKGRFRRFVSGHQSRAPRSAAWRAASTAVLAKIRPAIPWNKGRTYVISKRIVYANKGAWAAALIRLYGNRCMRCGWNEARCDAHHIVSKRHGGVFSIENGVLLCPNCHRVSHHDSAIDASLADLKAAAVVICQSY